MSAAYYSKMGETRGREKGKKRGEGEGEGKPPVFLFWRSLGAKENMFDVALSLMPNYNA